MSKDLMVILETLTWLETKLMPQQALRTSSALLPNLEVGLAKDLPTFIRNNPRNKTIFGKQRISTDDVIKGLKAFCKATSVVCPFVDKL